MEKLAILVWKLLPTKVLLPVAKRVITDLLETRTGYYPALGKLASELVDVAELVGGMRGRPFTRQQRTRLVSEWYDASKAMERFLATLPVVDEEKTP